MLAPAAAGGLITRSWSGALSAFFWAGLVRVSLLHHVTWSINSICHVVGERPFELRKGDKATNFWPLAILSFGESWHNLHHADPTCARHGVCGPDRHLRPYHLDLREVRLGARRALAEGGPPGREAGSHARHDGSVTTTPPADKGSSRVRMSSAQRREQLIVGRPAALRRARLRRDLDRGDRRPGQGLQARRVRALRRQGRPVRGRRRPRGALAAGPDHHRADRRTPARAARTGRAGAARLHRGRDRRLPGAGPRVAGRCRRPATSPAS